MKRIRLILTMLFLFLSGLSLSAQGEVKLARSASDPGVNGVAYNFTGKLQSSTGQATTVQGMLALMSTGEGTMEGVLVDSLTDKTYSVKATHSRGFVMTFTGEDGSSFTGASAGFSGLVPPTSLSGKASSGLSGTWTATDANYFTIPSGTILFSPELACTFCQLIHFCGVITTIPCTACTDVCKKKK
ncbi:MAG: hypothetical protein R3D00_05505 [Bacteroidia bacterium]